VGPEGGWSREEIELALLEGARPKQLGPRTLRAEAAPIVLLSTLWTEWGWT
jgi:16S rRNA (uracil1498-N3)-methyltransferase